MSNGSPTRQQLELAGHTFNNKDRHEKLQCLRCEQIVNSQLRHRLRDLEKENERLRKRLENGQQGSGDS